MTMIKLAVPYLSQINGLGAGGFRNDCGPTCCWMLLKGFGLLKEGESVDSLYRSVVKYGDRYTSWQENMDILQAHGVFAQYGWDLRIRDVEESLKKGFVVMALINYGVLRQTINTHSTFSGNHFLLVVGMDEAHFFLHDSLWLNEQGRFLPVKKTDFERAWLAAEGTKGSALRMTRRMGVVEMVRYHGKVASSIGLNLRSGAGIGYEILGRLAFGEQVNLEDLVRLENGDVWGKLAGNEVWCAIRYQGSELMMVQTMEENFENVNESDKDWWMIVEKINTAIALLNEALGILK